MYKRKISFISQRIEPNWITGMCDRSGSFSIIVSKRKSGSWEIRPVFELLVNEKYFEILNKVQSFFNKGSIYKLKKSNNIIFRINKIKDINDVVIPHFKLYPLLSTKKVNYLLWLKCVELINLGKNKSYNEKYKLLSIYASIGRGPSKKVVADFPELISIEKPTYIKPSLDDLSEWWISGYFSIYCNFNVDMNPHGFKESIYHRVVPSFNFSRNIKESFLIELLASYFDVNFNLRSNNLRIDVNVYGLQKLESIIHLFNNFPLSSCKQKEFIIWAEIVNKLLLLSNIPKDYRLSLDSHIPLFIELTNKLIKVRNLNNSKL